MTALRHITGAAQGAEESLSEISASDAAEQVIQLLVISIGLSRRMELERNRTRSSQSDSREDVITKLMIPAGPIMSILLEEGRQHMCAILRRIVISGVYQDYVLLDLQPRLCEQLSRVIASQRTLDDTSESSKVLGEELERSKATHSEAARGLAMRDVRKGMMLPEADDEVDVDEEAKTAEVSLGKAITAFCAAKRRVDEALGVLDDRTAEALNDVEEAYVISGKLRARTSEELEGGDVSGIESRSELTGQYLKDAKKVVEDQADKVLQMLTINVNLCREMDRLANRTRELHKGCENSELMNSNARSIRELERKVTMAGQRDIHSNADNMRFCQARTRSQKITFSLAFSRSSFQLL